MKWSIIAYPWLFLMKLAVCARNVAAKGRYLRFRYKMPAKGL
jgi:hypothetical protein